MMRKINTTGLLTVLALLLGTGAAPGNADASIIVTDDWEAETLGDNTSQLANWNAQGTAANGVIVDSDPGAGVNQALQIGQSAGINKNNMNLTGAHGLSVKFDFTNIQPTTDGAWFGLFLRDTVGSNPLYRVQWQGTNSSLIVRKTNTSLSGWTSLGSALFADHSTHNIELRLLFSPGDDPNSGFNTLELLVDSVSHGTVTDFGGVTSDGAGNFRRLVPNATWSIQLVNFNAEATALNLLDNITIATIPTPAALPAGLAMLGTLLMRRR